MPAANAVAALAAFKQRRRYDQVMGDRQPRVADKQFVVELSARLDSYYLAGQRAKEKQLADAEKKRERRLIEDGVLRTRTQLPAGRRTLGRSRSRRRREAASDGGHSKEIWPSNSSNTVAAHQQQKHTTKCKQEGQESLLGSDEASRLERMLRSLPPTPASRRQQEIAETTATSAAYVGEEEAATGNNGNSDDQLSCNLTVDQLYWRALDTIGRRT